MPVPDGGPGPGPAQRVVRVAVPSPLRQTFDYLPPPDDQKCPLVPGARVRVPFGRRTRIGVVVAADVGSRVPATRLKAIAEVIDTEALIPPESLEFLMWASTYFQYPVGEVVLGTLPPPLRRGRRAAVPAARGWRLTASGRDLSEEKLRRAPRQRDLWARLRSTPAGLGNETLARVGGDWRRALESLRTQGWVERVDVGLGDPRPEIPMPPVDATPAQRAAIDTIGAALGRFDTFLLDGVTGSGKTEVYLSLIARVVDGGRQALVLVPEIGLTPQVVERFRTRLTAPVVVLHSGLAEGARLGAWLASRNARAAVVIGTRSAVFVPLARPGIVIVDEEHDVSFKQQDGFRYSARDLAVLRARRWGVPVVLGSATPSLESLNNVARGRYRDLRLPQRASGASPPRIELVDLRGRPFDDGLSLEMATGLEQTLHHGEQALLFVNRRGYAPVMICHACGWHAECVRCDAHLVYHREVERLCCHHCGAQCAAPMVCPQCASDAVQPLGLGTQRVAAAIETRFPGARVVRVDRDATRRKGMMEDLLGRVRRREIDILVGTQMLAKGHHFPSVTLAGILDADSGLFGADFRAGERMAQLLVQVAGRAGRGERPGRVLLQTHHPTHPMLRLLIREGYRPFAEAALLERDAARLPPYTSMALLRAEAPSPEAGQAFLIEARELALIRGPDAVCLSGPVPAPMERRAGRHRAQLLLEADDRASLQRLLGPWIRDLEGLRSGRRVRWSIDVDPQEML